MSSLYKRIIAYMPKEKWMSLIEIADEIGVKPSSYLKMTLHAMYPSVESRQVIVNSSLLHYDRFPEHKKWKWEFKRG